MTGTLHIDYMTPIPAGAIFTVTSGEYSDYYIVGVFRALREIEPNILLKQWLTNHPEQQEDYNFEEKEFLAWITQNGYLEVVDCYNWKLESYSSASFMSVSKISED
jgi:hypothetical protein